MEIHVSDAISHSGSFSDVTRDLSPAGNPQSQIAYTVYCLDFSRRFLSRAPDWYLRPIERHVFVYSFWIQNFVYVGYFWWCPLTDRAEREGGGFQNLRTLDLFFEIRTPHWAASLLLLSSSWAVYFGASAISRFSACLSLFLSTCLYLMVDAIHFPKADYIPFVSSSIYWLFAKLLSVTHNSWSHYWWHLSKRGIGHLCIQGLCAWCRLPAFCDANMGTLRWLENESLAFFDMNHLSFTRLSTTTTALSSSTTFITT